MVLATARTIGEWVTVTVLLTVGLWLVLKREAWARDVYALRPLGRGGEAISARSVLTIITAIWLTVVAN